MKIRKLKIILTLLQAAFLAAFFLPVAVSGESGAALNTLELVRRYTGLGYRAGSIFYLFMAIGSPLVTILLIWTLPVRKNFGASAWLSTLAAMTNVCFYSAAAAAFQGSVRFTGTHYLICFGAVVSLFVSIHAYLVAAPKHGIGGGRQA